jgi:hypothetical protein
MASRRLGVGHGTIASLFVASLLLGSGCSSDSNVSFDDGKGPGGGGDGATAGTAQASSGKGSGAAAGSSTQGGSASGGKQNSAGTDTGGGQTAGTDAGGTDAGGTNGAGTNGGGTDSGGTDAGGTDAGGTTSGGTDTGGTDSGGTSSAGNSGAGGGAGIGGTGGGAGGSAGTAGTGGSAGMSGSGGSSNCTPKTEVCDGADNNCDGLVDPLGTCPDGCTGATYGGHTYYFCGLVDSAGTALNKCTAQNMVLISIETAPENTFVAGKIKGSTWLGGSDEAKEGEWRWITGNDLFWDHGTIDGKYSNWLGQPQQPNDNGPNNSHENCLTITPTGAVVTAGSGKWNDINCGLTGSRWACESTGPAIGAGGP